MIDFSTLRRLTIPDGRVKKIEAGGMVLWQEKVNDDIILEVKKITDTVYTAEGTKEETFILLSVYGISGEEITVTYGGLTKTVKFSGFGENVFFGTFRRESDEVETPASGTLVIKGNCTAVAVGNYPTGKNSPNGYYSGVTAITSLGSITELPDFAFYNCYEITDVTIPATVTSVGSSALPFTGDSTYTHTITMLSTTPPAIEGSLSLGYYGVVTIVVPAGCAEVYKSAEGWDYYADVIVEGS